MPNLFLTSLTQQTWNMFIEIQKCPEELKEKIEKSGDEWVSSPLGDVSLSVSSSLSLSLPLSLLSLPLSPSN